MSAVLEGLRALNQAGVPRVWLRDDLWSLAKASVFGSEAEFSEYCRGYLLPAFDFNGMLVMRRDARRMDG